MYYLGVPPELKDARANNHVRGLGKRIEKADGSTPAGAVSPKLTRQARTPIEMIMACDNGPKDVGFSPSGRQARPLDFASQHIRFRPDMPTRASQLAINGDSCPVDESVFAVSSPGDVSPISTTSSSMKVGSIAFSGQSVGVIDKDRPAEMNPPVSSASGQSTSSQRSRPGKPSLTLTIPDSTRKRPVEVTHPSPGSGIHGIHGIQASAESTPIDTPAHARRLPARTGSGAAKSPRAVPLADELALFSLPSAGMSAPPVGLSASEPTNQDTFHIRVE
ncbi:MAG: hypothetical protein Q9182_001620 [Xanthomendoza sp. 2 TL-2023]